jgi:hypothetical protein
MTYANLALIEGEGVEAKRTVVALERLDIAI